MAKMHCRSQGVQKTPPANQIFCPRAQHYGRSPFSKLGVYALCEDQRIKHTIPLQTHSIMSVTSPPKHVHLYAACTLEDHYMLVMEYATEGTLVNLLEANKNGSLPVVTGLASDILIGLIYLHEKNFIHRDLKPANILLVQERQIESQNRW